MTIVGGLLLVLDGSMWDASRTSNQLVATTLTLGGDVTNGGLFATEAELDRERWQAIVIHHSASPVGDVATMTRQQIAHGFEGLGYHFVIGNGNGMPDGSIHPGPAWQFQQPGRHAIGSNGPWFNEHALGICLVGNGDSRGFTEHQMQRLVLLVRQLQQRLEIPADRVFLHREIADDIRSPGQFFAEASFRQQLIMEPR